MLRLTKLLMTTAAVLALTACGSSEVASPGEGNFGNGGTTTPGGGTVTPPAAGQAAADCPAGTSNVGTVAGGTLRACQLPTQIVGNLLLPLRAGTIYSISGRTEVGSDRGASPISTTGAQGILTIEAGVKVFASGGADYLLVNRGSQIFAEGTATNPIVFTSRQNVEGQTTANSQGQWGGIVIAGRAPTAVCPVGVTAPNEACVGQVEGTSANYGGNTPADNSGRLRYVQVNYSGFELSPNNELQALTLAGVGSGTVIEYFQSYNSSDDGIEIFGGNVNLRYLVINGADDDGLDTDTGWRGGAQFGIVTQRPTAVTNGSRGFEWSAAPSGTAYFAEPKVANFTIVGRNAAVAADALITLNSGTRSTIINSVFTNPTTSAAACLDIDDANTVSNTPVFQSVYLACSRPYEDDSNVNAAATSPFFTGGSNNTATGTSTLTAPTGATMTNTSLTFINGANETAVTPANAAALYSFFQTTTYIGAVRNAADTWFSGWTCGLRAGSTC